MSKSKYLTSILTLFIAGFVLSSFIDCSAADASYVWIGTSGPYNVQIEGARQYAWPGPDNVIECKPEAINGHFAGPYPVVMLIHGGGWGGGDNSIDQNSAYSGRWCSLWASWGFAAFSVGYRLSGEAAWPAQIVDVQAAIRWVRANSGSLGVNPGLIVVNGDSAGGQLAMIAGYSYQNVPGDLDGYNDSYSPQPQVVISEFGPWDWGPYQPSGTPSVRAEDYASQLIVARNDGRTTLQTPNTLFVQGTQDTIVNECTESETGYRFLKSNNRPASYLAYNGGHEFTDMNSSTWGQVVGGLQMQTISFAYYRAHYVGKLPASEKGPQTSFTDLSLPICY